MVTSKVDSQSQAVAVTKMNSVRARKPAGSNLSGLRLLESDQLGSNSSVSKNSVYKLKIDLMFDDSRSMRSNRLDDTRGSHRTRSIIMYGRSELASTAGESSRSIASFLQESSESTKDLAEAAKKDVQRISNSVQAQIEQLFTDVAKDATSSFEVTCLGSLPLKDKVTSLQGLQEPLRHLYLSESFPEKLATGLLDICATGLRVRFSYQNSRNQHGSSNVTKNKNDALITPFHNIAVWSAVKFVISEEDGGAAFLPLITDPENIDKTALFQPLSPSEQQLVATGMHAPIFAVVMRSAGTPKTLECHGFICKSTEDAIVIAATLYQSLMSHVSTNSHRSTKRRTPRNQNGVSCISIASSSALTSSNYLSRSQIVPSVSGRKSSFHSQSNASGSIAGAPNVSRSGRKKRVSNSSLSSHSNIIKEHGETSTEERKRKSHKTKRAPPVPSSIPGSGTGYRTNGDIICSNGHINVCGNSQRKHQPLKKSADSAYAGTERMGNVNMVTVVSTAAGNGGGAGGLRGESSGDILTRVAIPRSGSFLNTGGLTRYKSRAARRHSGKLGGGGGGGSPLGFSELFNEFRLHENLHSLDDILYAIIDADGMSFNDLKPIYKEFLLKLAVTLTQDELFQRSKNIMRRQKKKKQKRKSPQTVSKNKPRTAFFGTKSLKKVFQLGQFRACRGKSSKPSRSKEVETKRQLGTPIIISPATSINHHNHQTQQQLQQQHRNRVGTSGSDVSVVRPENTFHGLNRNSSSGYVSCSECSYDSETCTCVSADRCYCSLRTEHLNHKMRHKNELNIAMSRNQSTINRDSLISCKSDDKCYCSMVEEEPNTTIEDDSVNTNSDTTWCDTDSCISASKCYCKRAEQRRNSVSATPLSQSRKTGRKPAEKLGLDYELFSITSNSKPVRPHEALSVKKSVEAAAVFADMKLSQTTDIKSLCQANGSINSNQKQIKHMQLQKSNGSCRSYAKRPTYISRESISIDRAKERSAIIALSSNGSQKSCSADDLLNRLTAMEKAAGAAAASISSAASRSRKGSYQSMRAVSTSLEDSLGYLP